MANNNKFFYHDIFSRHSMNIAFIIKKLGHKGYACYFMLLEVFAASNEYSLDLNKEYVYDYLQDQLFLNSVEEVKDVLELFKKADLIHEEEGIIYSSELRQHMTKVDEICQKRSVARKGKTKKSDFDTSENKPFSKSDIEGYEEPFKHIDKPKALEILPEVQEAFEEAYTNYVGRIPDYTNHPNKMEKNSFRALMNLISNNDLFQEIKTPSVFFNNLFEKSSLDSKSDFIVSTAYNSMIEDIYTSTKDYVSKYKTKFTYIKNGNDLGVINELQKLN